MCAMIEKLRMRSGFIKKVQGPKSRGPKSFQPDVGLWTLDIGLAVNITKGTRTRTRALCKKVDPVCDVFQRRELRYSVLEVGSSRRCVPRRTRARLPA